MQFSTLCPLPAGAAIFRDNRCWHGGTPNLSERFRALPNAFCLMNSSTSRRLGGVLPSRG